jgi:hypothetical protein
MICSVLCRQAEGADLACRPAGAGGGGGQRQPHLPGGGQPARQDLLEARDQQGTSATAGDSTPQVSYGYG